MKDILGISNNNIFGVYQTIKNCVDNLDDKEQAKYRVQSLGFSEAPKSGATIILVPTVARFLKQIDALNASNAIVLVFDTPVLLEYLKPIKLLDCKKKASYLYQFVELTTDKLMTTINTGFTGKRMQVESQTIDVIPTILNSVHGSILNHILTFLYSVPNTDKRYQYQNIIYSWIQSQDDVDHLEIKLKTLMKKKSVGFTKFIEYMKSDITANTRAAIKEIFELKAKKKPIMYKRISSVHQVNEFDLKYLLKAIRKANNFIDYGEGHPLEEMFNTRKKTA